MLWLRVNGPVQLLTETGRWLEATGRARQAIVTNSVDPGRGLLTADLRPEGADEIIDRLSERGIDPGTVSLMRLEEVTPGRTRGPGSLIWVELIGQARRNARPIARYLVFMAVAGIIAGVGVLTVNSTLIVGAMAVSPDTLPITAACVGLVGRRPTLAGRSLGTLAIGLSVACSGAASATLLLRASGRVPGGFQVGEAALAGLVTISTGTVVVALVAGIAAMLAVETKASAAVGVAISVTTIPATAYLGVAAAFGQIDRVPGAAALLGVNIAMILAGGTVTLAIQGRIESREEHSDGSPKP